MSKLTFLQESLKNMKTMGTVIQTSNYAAKTLAGLLHFDNIDIIVELGGGDGAITKHLLKKMKRNARLIVFEVNESFCDKLRAIEDPRILVIPESAENLDHVLHQMGIVQVDAIVSSIPFAILPEPFHIQILNLCNSILKPGASFLQIHYSLFLKNLYQQVFGNVDVEFAAFNIPPVFIMHSKKVNPTPDLK